MLPGAADIRRVERYQLLMRLLALVRRRRRMLTELQALVARVVRAAQQTADGVELTVSVYDSLRDQKAGRFKEAMVRSRTASSHCSPCSLYVARS